MLPCPLCQQVPQWHFARNVSRQRQGEFFLIEGCKHSEAFAKPFDFISDREAFAAKWNAEAERMFVEYTASWTQPQRASYRARLFAVKPDAELNLA